ncbi:MAG: UDP-glucuronate decarboxylase N-terminal [Rhodobacteraceae bacterium HLUCCA08]|nr:MAG: UDP-glucuronate decarboxylase N-terminal [Rhodobacteraceae bacterium HLUCCA08]
MVWRLIKLVFALAVLAAIAFVAYAYLGPIFFAEDFAPPVEQVIKPVTLEPE